MARGEKTVKQRGAKRLDLEKVGAPAEGVDGVERFRLDNGLTVVLKEQHGSPVVAFQAWVGVGSADEPEELAGIAHVFEHMLFKGTARRGVGRIAQEMESAGGDINAWTSFDQTVFHLVLASRYFDTGLDLLTDALRNSSFDPDELGRELKVVLEEIKQGEDSPSRVVTQSLFGAAYTQHTYRRPVIGYVDTVSKFRRDGLLDFFKRHYVPNNITFVVVGDFDRAQARRKLAAAWHDARPRPLAVPDVALRSEPAQRRTRTVAAGAKISEAHLVVGFHIPGIKDHDTPALDLGAILLGQGESSRLQLEVRRRRQLVNEVYAYSFTPRDPGLLVIGATLRPEDVDMALGAILDEVYQLAAVPPARAEVDKAQAIVDSDSVYQKETVQGMARKLGFFETVTGSLAFEEEYLRRTRAVTPAEVSQAFARYVRAGNCTVSLLVPEAQAEGKKKQLEASLARLVAEAETRAQAKHPRPADDKPNGKAGRRGSPRPAADVVREVLDNGTRVLVLRDASVPLVAVRAVWLGGLREEDPSSNGVSNLLSQLITRGTGSRTGEQIAREIESVAGSLGGFAGRNSFGVRAEFIARHLEHGLDVFADCVLDPAFHQDDIDKERRQILEEIRTQEDNASSVAFRLFGETLYRAHPYRMDMLGTAASVESLTRKKIAAHYNKRYAPSRMSIAIVGDVEPGETIERVRRLFAIKERGALAPTAQPKAEAPIEAPRRAERFKDKQQAHLVIGFPGTIISDGDRYVLEVLSTILSGQGGRLFVELREKKGLAYRVSAFALEGLDPGYFAVYIATGPENLAVAEAGMLAELEKIRDKPVGKAELDRARRYLVGAHDISLQRRSSLAATLSFNECYGLGWDQYRRYAQAIGAVTADDLQRIARKYLDPRRSVTAVVRPEAAVVAKPLASAARAARGPARPSPKK